MKSIYGTFIALFLCQWKFYLNPNITEVHVGYINLKIEMSKYKNLILQKPGFDRCPLLFRSLLETHFSFKI